MSTAKFTVRRPASAKPGQNHRAIQADPEDTGLMLDEHQQPDPADVAAVNTAIVKAPKKPAGPLGKLASLRTWVNACVIGREPVVEALLLAVVARQNCLFLGPPGCLAGSTMIRVNRAGKGWSMRIDELVARYTGSDAHMAGRPWDRSIPTMVARSEGGLVRLCPLESAWVSGIKEVFELRTASGRTIRATADHPFMVPDGSFVRLGDLKPGDSILSAPRIVESMGGRTKIQYRDRYTKFHPRQRRAKDGFRVPEHQLVVEARLNGMDLSEFLEIVRRDGVRAGQLRYLEPGQVVHHKDEDPRNNADGNLEIKDSQAEHAADHAESITPSVCAKVTADRIISIKPKGEEMTYDLEVSGDPHCFLANDIVVHNTAKTYCVHKVASAFASKPGDVFDILLTKFSKPIELLGPISIKGLENDDVRYCTEGFLPAAKVGVLDEVFKGSSAILNSLLQLANERRFRNGRTIEASPLRILVGMSNEFPEDPATLAAFFDRFPIKLMVTALESGDFAGMLNVAAAGNGKAPCPVTLTDADLAAIDAGVAAVTVPADVLGAIGEIRDILAQKAVLISDRRWVQAVSLIRAHAYLAGRTAATRTDLKVLELVCWNAAAETAVVKQIIPDFLNPFEAQLRATIDDVYNERERILAAGNLDGADKTRPNPDMAGMCGAAASAIVRIKNTAERVKIIAEDMAQTDEDKALSAQAAESIAAVLSVINDIVRGKAGVAELKATEAKDTH